MATPTKPSDEDLVHAAQQGRQEAFNVLFERYLPLVHNRVRYVVPEQDAEDVTQEVFLTYYRLSGKKENVPQYLYAIAHSRCIDILRREKRKHLFAKNFSYEAYEEAAEDSFFRNEYSYELQAALDTLTDYERSVLLLKSVSGLSFREISEVLKKKEPALRKQFQRAKLKIEKRIKREGAESNDEGIPVF